MNNKLKSKIKYFINNLSECHSIVDDWDSTMEEAHKAHANIKFYHEQLEQLISNNLDEIFNLDREFDGYKVIDKKLGINVDVVVDGFGSFYYLNEDGTYQYFDSPDYEVKLK